MQKIAIGKVFKPLNRIEIAAILFRVTSDMRLPIPSATVNRNPNKPKGMKSLQLDVLLN